jgi:C_GCAxxG_C_C family probable redox protein
MTDTTQSTLADTIAARAENLYRTRQHLCADAVLLAFNEGLGGGLTEQQAVGLTSGLSIGQGGAGCLCGAVSGGALVLGLFLGGEGRAYRDADKVREAVNALHIRFKDAHKSTCCRVLTRAVKDDEAAHFEQCAGLTGEAARVVAEILFNVRPELAERADRGRLAVRDSKGRGLVRRVINRLFR